METGILTTLFKNTINTIIAVGTFFYSSIDGVRSDFSPIYISVSDNRVVVSTQLINGFSEELDKIFRSGQQATIYFNLELYSIENHEPIFEQEFVHSFRFSLIDQTFDLFKSEMNTVQIGLDIAHAKNEITKISEVTTMDISQFKNNIEYYFRITSWLGDIQLQGMEKPVNLMKYWSNIRPVRLSQKFDNMVATQ